MVFTTSPRAANRFWASMFSASSTRSCSVRFLLAWRTACTAAAISLQPAACHTLIGVYATVTVAIPAESHATARVPLIWPVAGATVVVVAPPWQLAQLMVRP